MRPHRVDFAHQPPPNRAWLAVMKRVERVWKVSDVTSAGFEGQVERCSAGLSVADEDSHPSTAERASQLDSAAHFGRERHQSRV